MSEAINRSFTLHTLSFTVCQTSSIFNPIAYIRFHVYSTHTILIFFLPFFFQSTCLVHLMTSQLRNFKNPAVWKQHLIIRKWRWCMYENSLSSFFFFIFLLARSFAVSFNSVRTYTYMYGWILILYVFTPRFWWYIHVHISWLTRDCPVNKGLTLQ